MNTLDPAVTARCNMFGVLRNIEYLMEKDPECKAAAQGNNISIRFRVKGCFTSRLTFAEGRAELVEESVEHKPSKPADIRLYFSSPDHFNKMIAGKANPLPTGGFTRLGFLKGPFMKITDKIEKYLRPEEVDLKDERTFRMNTEMTAYTAFFALAEIANHDIEGKMHASGIPNGVLQLEIGNGPELWIEVENGFLTPHRGRHNDPRAFLSFRDLQAAHEMLNAKIDTFTSLGLGHMEIRGFVPMIEHLNPILDLVGRYLA